MLKIKTSRRLSFTKEMKNKKMENSRVLWIGCFRQNWDVLSMFFARVELVNPSDVPEKAYNSRPSEFGSFLACTCIHAFPT